MKYVRMRIKGGILQEVVHAVKDGTRATLCGVGLGYNGPDVFTEDVPTCISCASIFEKENPLLKQFPTAAQKAYSEIMATLPPDLRRQVKDFMFLTIYGGGVAKLAKATEAEFDEHFEAIKKIIEDAYPLKESGEQGV